MFLLFVVHQMAIGLFRMMAAIARDIVLANTFGAAALLIIFLLGGFIVPKGRRGTPKIVREMLTTLLLDC